jgi:hypothetical protein
LLLPASRLSQVVSSSPISFEWIELIGGARDFVLAGEALTSTFWSLSLRVSLV